MAEGGVPAGRTQKAQPRRRVRLMRAAERAKGALDGQTAPDLPGNVSEPGQEMGRESCPLHPKTRALEVSSVPC